MRRSKYGLWGDIYLGSLVDRRLWQPKAEMSLVSILWYEPPVS